MKYLVLDVDGSAIKYASMDKKAVLLERGQVATPLDSFDDFRAEIISLYKHYQDQIAGIAFSLPGVIESEQGYCITGGSLSYNYKRDFIADIQTFLPATHDD